MHPNILIWSMHLKGLQPIDNFFGKPYAQILHIFRKYLLGLGLNGFKVYNLGLGRMFKFKVKL
jgi:hypothetical protein